MPTPLVSVVIPVYNAEKTITRCLESVKAQTWTTLQIICVDDCSTDRSHARIADCIASDSRCTLLPPKHENLGPAAARNAGIREATGDLLYFIDADDWVEPCAIETLVQCWRDHAVELVVGGYIQEKGHGVSLYRDLGLDCDTRLSRQALIDYCRNYLRVPYRYALPSSCWGRLYDFKIIREHGILFDERLIHQEDVAFSFQYLCHVEAVFFSRSFNYHFTMSLQCDSTTYVTLGPHDAQTCALAFSPIKKFVDRMDTERLIANQELGHLFVTTAIIYILRLAGRFLDRPSVRDFRNIKSWLSSATFRDNLRHYRRQSGESAFLHLALQTRMTPVVLIAAVSRELILRKKAKRGG